MITHLFMLYIVYSGAFLSKCFGDFPSPALLLVTAALALPTRAAGPQWDSPVRAVRSVLLSYYCFPAG